MNNTAAALIVGIALVLAAFLIGGRYTVATNARGVAYVLDRFTGDVNYCLPNQCRPVPKG